MQSYTHEARLEQPIGVKPANFKETRAWIQDSPATCNACMLTFFGSKQCQLHALGERSDAEKMPPQGIRKKMVQRSGVPGEKEANAQQPVLQDFTRPQCM